MNCNRLRIAFSISYVLGTLFLLACSGTGAPPTPNSPTATGFAKTGTAIPAPTVAVEPTNTPRPTATTGPSETGPASSAGTGSQTPVFVEVAVWGQADDDSVTFRSPNGIAIDSSDNVCVTEFQGNRVQKFTSDGIPLAQWGSGGSEDGQFQSPIGIAIDQIDHVYVAESGNNRVQKFTSNGEWLASWGSRGNGPGENS